ncbi:eukaryotic translation initiation factor 3 subunit C [Apiospora arundinis]
MAGIPITTGSIVIDRLDHPIDEVPQLADQMLTRIFPAIEWEEETRGRPEITALHVMIVGDGTITMIVERLIGIVTE